MKLGAHDYRGTQPQTHQVLRHVTNWQRGQFATQSIGFLQRGDIKLLEPSTVQKAPEKDIKEKKKLRKL